MLCTQVARPSTLCTLWLGWCCAHLADGVAGMRCRPAFPLPSGPTLLVRAAASSSGVGDGAAAGLPFFFLGLAAASPSFNCGA